MRTLPFLFALTLTGCDDYVMEPIEADPADCPPGFVPLDDDSCAFDEAAVIEVMQDFEDGRLVKVNTEPFLQVMGPSFERNVWVSPVPVKGTALTAVELYRMVQPDANEPLPEAFPEGTLIIHETIDRSEGHTVQVKLGEDYDDGYGRNWFTGKYFDDGTPDEEPCSPCIMCHNDEQRPYTEGLWGVPDDVQ